VTTHVTIRKGDACDNEILMLIFLRILTSAPDLSQVTSVHRSGMYVCALVSAYVVSNLYSVKKTTNSNPSNHDQFSSDIMGVTC
jgi:hypothetical protein